MGQGLPPQSPAVTAPLLGELALRESFFAERSRPFNFPLSTKKAPFRTLFSIIVQINVVNQINKFLNSPSGKGTCDNNMPCAGITEKKFRLFGGNVVAVRLCDDSDNRLRKTHGKHLGKAAYIVSAVMAETNDIRVISGCDCGAAAEKRSIGIFAGGVDCVGPGFDGLGFVISHIKIMEPADKGRFSAAGTADEDYFPRFNLLCKAEGTVIFLPVFRIDESGIYGIFFGQQKNTSENIVYGFILSVFALFFNRFSQKGFIEEQFYVINKS